MRDHETWQRKNRGGPAGFFQRTAFLLSLILASWVAGAALQTAASVLIFPDLPALPLGHLVKSLVASAVRFLPIGLILGLFVGGPILLILRRRYEADRLLLGVGAALPVAALLLSLVVVLVAAGTLAFTTAVVLLIIALAMASATGWWVARRPTLQRWVILAILCVGAPLWLAVLSRIAPSATLPGSPLASAGGQRVVLLGLDGATWSMMRPMMDRGELPHIARLMERGAHAPLRSLEPLLSNRIWTSAATGVVPERHGIIGFFFDRRAIRVPTMWDLVHQQEGRLGILEYLVTDPPLAANGFVLPGWMAANPADTHPPRLTRRLRILTAVRHPWIALRYLARRKRVDPRLNVREFTQARFKASAFLELHARFQPDLAACIWYGTDRLGHKLWRYHEPEAFNASLDADDARIVGVLPDYYREVDRQVGRVVDALDDGQTFFLLMSDHGMGPTDEVRVTAVIRGYAMLRALHLQREFFVESPHSELILNCRVEGRTQPWTVPREKHRQAVEAAAARFRAIRRADTGVPLCEVSLMDLEQGDLKIRVSDPASLSHDTPLDLGDRQVPADEVISLGELSGGHRLHGIVVVAGFPARQGAGIIDPAVVDVAPTILHALGLPVAEDLDGRVLEEVFAEGWRADHPVRRVPSYGSVAAPLTTPHAPTDEQLERLRSLGYIQ